MSRTPVPTAARRPAPGIDTTGPTLAWLRSRRRAGQVQRLGYAAYVVTLLVVSWYGLYAAGLLHRLRDGDPLAHHAGRIVDVLPSALVLTGFAGWWFTVRDALWRGPVTLPAADVDWLLPLPVRRARVLAPPFLLSVAVWTFAALLAGFAAALVSAAAGLGSVGVLAPACMAVAFCLAVLGVVAATVVEASDAVAEHLRRATPAAALLAALFAAHVFAAAEGTRWKAVESVALWSGPWGWAAQPVLAATGEPPPGWPISLGLLVATTVAGAAAVPALLTGMPARNLRRRARTTNAVLAAVLTMDLRAARLSAAAGLPSPPGAPTRWTRRVARLPAPRRPWLLVPWRDAVALLAAPRRLGAAALLIALAGGLARIGADSSGAAVYAVAALAATVAYAATTHLLESARLDGDNSARAAWSPRPRGRLAVEHATVPTLVLVLMGTVTALVAAPASPWAAVAVAVAAAPVLVAGGLLNAYRKPAPVWLLGGSAGEFGPILVMLWQSAGPITGISGLVLLLGPLLADGPATSALLWGRGAGCCTLALAMLCLLRYRTRR